MIELNTAWLGKRQRVTTRITPQQKEWVVKECKKRGISVSEFLRLLVIEERRRHAVEWRGDYFKNKSMPPEEEL